MSKNRQGSAPVAKVNRKAARASKFKNTTKAREAGMVLPTKADLESQAASSGSPRKDLGAQAKNIVNQKKKEPPKGGTSGK